MKSFARLIANNYAQFSHQRIVFLKEWPTIALNVRFWENHFASNCGMYINENTQRNYGWKQKKNFFFWFKKAVWIWEGRDDLTSECEKKGKEKHRGITKDAHSEGDTYWRGEKKNAFFRWHMHDTIGVEFVSSTNVRNAFHFLNQKMSPRFVRLLHRRASFTLDFGAARPRKRNRPTDPPATRSVYWPKPRYNSLSFALCSKLSYPNPLPIPLLIPVLVCKLELILSFLSQFSNFCSISLCYAIIRP